MVDAAAADGQAALAITDLSNLFGAVKFYGAARKAGVKPILGADVWLEAEGGERSPSRLLLLAQDLAGYHHLCTLLSRAWTAPAAGAPRGQASIAWDWLAEAGEGLIALSGADAGAVGQALLAGDGERARRVAGRLAALFPRRFYIEVQRAGQPADEAHLRAAVPLAAALGLPVVATHPAQFLAADDYDAHEARVCVAEGETLVNPRRARRFTREQYFKTQAQMEALFADLPSALANTVAIARRCNLSLVLGRPQLPAFPTPAVDGRVLADDEYFRYLSHQGLEQRLAELYPDEGKRARERCALRRAARLRDRDDPEDGLSRLLPDRRRLHQLGQGQRLPGRAGPRLGRGVAGRLRARHHRARPAALPAAVRALPQSRAGVDARLRHRLLPGQPRPRHRLRQAQVRPRRGEPDRHLRHHGRQGGAARRRPRARHGLRPGRQHRQARAGAAGQGGDAGPRARAARPGRDLRAAREPRDRGPRAGRGGGGRAALAGHARRGHRAQRRHARRRRAHRAGAHHRLLPALHAARQRLGGEPVRQGRRGGDRPRQVRLPGPRHADHPGAGARVHRAAPAEARRLRLRPAAARRRARLPAVLGGAHRVGVPVREQRHAAHAQGRAAEPHRGPDRAQRDVPPRPDGEHPHLLPAQARQGGGELPAPAAGDRARRNLRRHGLPGAGDAGRAGARRLLARRRRPAAPRDGQEEGRRDGAPPRHLPRGRGRPRASRRRSPTRCST